MNAVVSVPDGTGIFKCVAMSRTVCIAFDSGARLQDLRLEIHPASITLGYPNMDAYLENSNYLAVTNGRFANRLVGDFSR